VCRLQTWRALRNCAKKDLEAGRLSCTGQMRNACKFSVGGPAGQEHFERLCVDEKIILTLIVKK
jgi:hypothetical protein